MAVTLEQIFLMYPQTEGLKLDIEGAEVPILEEMIWMPPRLKWIVLEYSFEFYIELSRFRALISHLEL